MQISKIITTVVATACVSTAVPTGHNDGGANGNDGNAICGNGQVVSCCNSSGDKGAGLLDNLLGGNCSPLSLDGKPSYPTYIPNTTDKQIVLNLVPLNLNKACGNNQAACCTGNQNVSTSVHHSGRTFTHQLAGSRQPRMHQHQCYLGGIGLRNPQGWLIVPNGCGGFQFISKIHSRVRTHCVIVLHSNILDHTT